MNLAAFPPEVLQKMTIFLSGQTLCRLWRVGSPILSRKLSIGGGITEALFQDSQALGISRWPGIVDSLTRLTFLKISYDNCRLCEPPMLWDHLSKLTLLRTLNLGCVEAEEWLLEPLELSLDMVNFFDEDEDYIASDHPPTTKNRLRPFQTTFPHLLSLELRTSNCVLIDSDLAQFPPTLTRLALPCNSTLTSASLNFFPGQHLQTLCTSWDLAWDEVKFAKVPSTVTSIDMRYWQQMSLSVPMRLQLTHLRGNFRKSSFQHLPVTLTSLEFSNGDALVFEGNGGPPGRASLTHLVHLTSLSFESYYQHDFSYIPDLPSQLEHLRCEFEVTGYVAKVTDTWLPSKLKSLKIFLAGEIDETKFTATLPATLESLTIRHRYQMKAALLSTLPQSLTFFAMPERLYGIDPPKSLHVFDDIVSKLSRSLTHLQLNRVGSLSASHFALLPRSLTHLEFAVFGKLKGERVKELPSGLAHLSILMCPTPMQLEIANSWDRDCFQSLPRHLHDFSLLECGIHYTKEMVSALPRGLKVLRLSGTHFHDDNVKCLPPNLVEFRYQGSNAITSGGFCDLPRELRVLQLPNAEYLKDEEVKFLPPFIKRLQFCGRCSLTVAALPMLPPSLAYLDMDTHPLSAAFQAEIKRRRNDPSPPSYSAPCTLHASRSIIDSHY